MAITWLECAALAHWAGLRGDARVIAVAVANGESALNPQALGDENIVDLGPVGWGPSYGLWQIRTRVEDTGTGRPRDITILARSMRNQARSMVIISSNGTTWSPWSVFTSGRYRQSLDQARAAVEHLDRLRHGSDSAVVDNLPSDAHMAVGASGETTVGASDNPLDPTDPGSGVVGDVVQGTGAALGGAAGALAGAGAVLGNLLSGAFWLRVLVAVLGLAGLILAGRIMLAETRSPATLAAT